MIAVFIQHTTPYLRRLVRAQLGQQRPVRDAITPELIPEIDRRFRTVAAPHARLLTGGSTGGWDVLALQTHYPDVFGGAWALYPDQLDFRSYQFGDIYADTNAFVRADGGWLPREVPSNRTVEGLVALTVREENQAEAVIASRGRSGGQWDGWQAAWAPVGADGYPKPLWDKRTGTIDRTVARPCARADTTCATTSSATGDARSQARRQAARGGGRHGQLLPQPRRLPLRAFLESTREPGKGPYWAGTVDYGRRSSRTGGSRGATSSCCASWPRTSTARRRARDGAPVTARS
jgi:hypothetical protein